MFDSYRPAWYAIRDELVDARRAFPAMRSYHEGYAIIKEKLDELWDEIKKHPSPERDRAIASEIIQVAAMARRFAEDLCSAERK